MMRYTLGVYFVWSCVYGITSGSVYFFAGGKSNYPNKPGIELYHPTIENLTCPIMPPPLNNQREHHTSFYHNNAIHICGGLGGPHTADTCISYSTKTKYWKTHTLSTPRRTGPITVVLRNILYLLGGYDSSSYYHGAEYTSLPLKDKPILIPVHNLNYKGTGSCVVKTDEDTMVIIGGWYPPNLHPGNSGYLSSSTQYNSQNSTSTSLPLIIEGRTNHGCAIVEKNDSKWIIVSGGRNKDGDLRSTEMLEVGGSSWVSLGDLNVARSGHASIASERGVLVMGGYRRGYGYMTIVEMLDWNNHYLNKPRGYFGVALEITGSMFNCTGTTPPPEDTTITSPPTCPTIPTTTPIMADNCSDAGCKNVFKGLGMCVDTSTAEWDKLSKIIDFSAKTKDGKCSRDCNCICFKHKDCSSSECDKRKGICLIPDQEENLPSGYKKSFPCNESLGCFCYVKESVCKPNRKCSRKKGKCFGKEETVPENAKRRGWCDKRKGCKCYKV